MEPKDLPKLWGAPDNSRLTRKQYSLRFPFHVMAKVNAINEMYPGKTKTEIMGDLLAAALDQFRHGLSNEPDEEDEAMGRDPAMAMCGQQRWFSDLVDKHMKKLEKEEGEAGSEDRGTGSEGEGRKRVAKGRSGKGRGERAPSARGASARASK
jgi:hypothetical protein